MRQAKWSSLQDKIIRPGIEEKFIPLVLYRGSTSLGRIHRLWNFAITCMEHDVDSFSQAIKLSHNPDYSHLCGPERPVKSHSTLGSIFGRLIRNPDVTNNIPRLLEYCNYVRGWKPEITPVSRQINSWDSHPERYAPWRTLLLYTDRHDGEFVSGGHRFVAVNGIVEITIAQMRSHPNWREIGRIKNNVKAQKGKIVKERSVPLLLNYPYIIHDPSRMSEHEKLVMAVNAVVPTYLPDFIRADVCQDLIVAILSGDLDRSKLQDAARPFVKEVMKMHPLKYGPISLDAPIPGTEAGGAGGGLGMMLLPRQNRTQRPNDPLRILQYAV